ncbi:MAG: hypothetical protein LC670_03830 [Flavobacteriales bacterium]|nr:hypothetical protein [Flavobacteriales bacterium]
MQQLLQSLKEGHMDILTLPNPLPGKGEILVRTHYSAISAGTEGKTVSDARKGYVAKARARKEEVAKVITLTSSRNLSNWPSLRVPKERLCGKMNSSKTLCSNSAEGMAWTQ